MDLFSEIEKRKAANVKKLAAFGVTAVASGGGLVKVITRVPKLPSTPWDTSGAMGTI